MNDDTISRQAAIMHFVRVSKDYECRMFELKEVTHELWQIPTAESEWIPVTERLPKDGQNIIATRSDDGTTDFGQYNAKKNWCVNDSYWPNAFDFVAWMPLPEPYMEEESWTAK